MAGGMAGVGGVGGMGMGGQPGMGGMPQGGMGGMPPQGGMGGFGPMGVMPGGVPGAMGTQGMGMGAPPMGAVPPPQQAVSEPPEDLACASAVRGAAWGSAKQHFRSLFAPGKSVPQLATKEAMSTALDGAMRDLKSQEALGPQAVDECGLGKLCLQLLSFSAIDDPSALVQLFTGFEQLASPVLTLLLDVPWVALAQAGWPFFGMLAQLNLRRAHVPGALNGEEVDGLNDPVAKAFQAELTAALTASDFAAVEKAAGAFLQKDTKGSALGPLTALAAQAAGSAPVQERLAILQGLQVAFKQVIGSAPELDIALGTQWPLWGLVHAAVEGLTV
mmetsp:Transcript_59598/g.184839  ORF Transcript_59598/g.184839 Transcript_59598/m.184839 type:complete len:332 (+) Transcript_59598:3-998(+)